MSSSFKNFKRQIDDAVELIDGAKLASFDGSSNSRKITAMSPENIFDTDSLIDRCRIISDKHEPRKPVIRTIHHLACTGGTLFSKCISALPNVFLLSEVHPYTEIAIDKNNPKYAPSDIATLTKYSGIPNQRQLAAKLFKSSIRETVDHLAQIGATLVLRDHSHADFNTRDSIPDKSEIISLLEDDYEIKSVLTVRNPLDSYASLVKNNWVHFEPKDFNEYCRRQIMLVEKFGPDNTFKYENLLDDPAEQIRALANALEIEFDNIFEDVFDIFSLTGDSGRKSSTIAPRSRDIPADLLKESEESVFFKQLLELVGY